MADKAQVEIIEAGTTEQLQLLINTFLGKNIGIITVHSIEYKVLEYYGSPSGFIAFINYSIEETKTVRN